MASCEKEEITPTIEETPLSQEAIQKINFKELPQKILSYFDQEHLVTFKGKKSNNMFGTARTDVPTVRNIHKKGRSSYTIALKKNPRVSGLYFDNIVITELERNRQKITILRYRPKPNWYYSPQKDIKDFSGTVEFYTATGELLGRLELLNGKGTEEPQEYKGFSTTCEYTWKSTLCVGDVNGGDSYSCTYEFEETCTTSYTTELAVADETGGGGGTVYEGGGGGGGTVTTTPIIEEEETNDPEDCNTFAEKVKEVVNLEGGFVDDPIDTGGATNKGISWPIWEKSAKDICNVEPTLENLKNLTDEQAKAIYKKLFWDPMLCDDIQDGDMRFLLFDFNVNAGPNAVKVLQQTLNGFGNNLTVDGGMGPATLNALNNTQDQVSLYNKFKVNRQKYYDDITAVSINRFLKKFPNASASDVQKKTMKKYINGWTNRNNSFKDKTEGNQTNVNC